MSELPAGWAWSTIGELAPYIQRGRSPKYADQSELPVVNQKCIRWTRLDTQHLKFIHPEQFDAWDEARRIQPGDVLWNSTGTGTVGRAYLVQARDCVPAKVVDSHVTIVRPSAAIEPRFLFSWIRSAAVQDQILDMCDGTTNQIELSRTAIAETAVPMAPATEQARIADQLNTLLARIQACQHRLEAIPALLTRFRQVVLDAAVSGNLTSAWRETAKVQRWRSTTIGQQTLSSYYGPRFGKDDYTSSSAGIPTVRTTDMDRVGRIHVSDETPRVLVPTEKLEQYLAKPGDLLITRTGSIGVMAIFEGDYPAIPSAYLIRFRFSDDLRARYAYYRLASPKGQSDLGLSATAVAQPNVNAEAIKRIALDLPSIAEQDEIIRRVESLFSVAERVEARLLAATTQAGRLVPLTLAKAFRGELVPQDPNDEPANALLARVAAERSTPATSSRPRAARGGRPPRAPKETSAMTKSRQDDDVMGKPYLAGQLRRLGKPAAADALFRVAELPVADFYKQLAWEVAQGHVKDNQTTLEPGHAAG